MFRNVICFMLYEDKKFNFSQDRNFFFSHVLHVYISFIFVLYCVKPFVSVYFCHKYTYIPTRLDAEAPGPRALRAGRQEAEAPGPALCRPVAIHERLGVGRAGSQPALPSTNLGVTGHPGPAAEARLVMKKNGPIYIPGLSPRRPGGSWSADPWPSDVPGLEPGGPAASQHRPTSDGSAEGPCHSKAEKLVIFLKKKKKKIVIFLKKKI